MRIGIIIVALMISGCATSGKQKVDTAKFVNPVSARTTTPEVTDVCPKVVKLKKTTWKQLVNYGSACVVRKKWARVEMFGNYLLSSEMDSPWGSYFLSLIEERRGNLDKSMWLVEMAQRRAPDVPMFDYQRARILWKQGEARAAVELVKFALEKDKSLLPAHKFLAQVYLRDLEYEKAATHFVAVLGMRPNDSMARNGIAECRKHGVEINERNAGNETGRNLARAGGM